MGKLDKSALAGALMLGGTLAGEPSHAEERKEVDVTGGVNSALVVELAPETLNQIVADYSVCIDELLNDVQDFKTDESISQEDIDFFEEDGQEHCVGIAESDTRIAESKARIAERIQVGEQRRAEIVRVGEQKRAEIRANTDRRVNAILAELFEGAKRERGL